MARAALVGGEEVAGGVGKHDGGEVEPCLRLSRGPRGGQDGCDLRQRRIERELFAAGDDRDAAGGRRGNRRGGVVFGKVVARRELCVVENSTVGGDGVGNVDGGRLIGQEVEAVREQGVLPVVVAPAQLAALDRIGIDADADFGGPAARTRATSRSAMRASAGGEPIGTIVTGTCAAPSRGQLRPVGILELAVGANDDAGDLTRPREGQAKHGRDVRLAGGDRRRGLDRKILGSRVAGEHVGLPGDLRWPGERISLAARGVGDIGEDEIGFARSLAPWRGRSGKGQHAQEDREGLKDGDGGAGTVPSCPPPRQQSRRDGQHARRQCPGRSQVNHVSANVKRSLSSSGTVLFFCKPTQKMGTIPFATGQSRRVWPLL